MSKKSRDKGNRGENKVAKLFAGWWGSDFTRTPSSGGFRTQKFRDDWNAAGDIVTPDESFPFCVEVKNAEGWHLEQLLTSPECLLVKWWRQAVEESPEDKIPLLVFTRNYQPFFFMIVEEEAACRLDGMRLDVDGYNVVLGLLEEEFFCTDPEQWKVLCRDEEE